MVHELLLAEGMMLELGCDHLVKPFANLWLAASKCNVLGVGHGVVFLLHDRELNGISSQNCQIPVDCVLTLDQMGSQRRSKGNISVFLSIFSVGINFFVFIFCLSRPIFPVIL